MRLLTDEEILKSLSLLLDLGDYALQEFRKVAKAQAELTRREIVEELEEQWEIIGSRNKKTVEFRIPIERLEALKQGS